MNLSPVSSRLLALAIGFAGLMIGFSGLTLQASGHGGAAAVAAIIGLALLGVAFRMLRGNSAER
ncbi:MAG: hypothetical protein ABFS14_06325 [Gemmatimonadota bacterium]